MSAPADPKRYERGALRWLERFIDERLPPITEVALAAFALAELRHGRRAVGTETLGGSCAAEYPRTRVGSLKTPSASQRPTRKTSRVDVPETRYTKSGDLYIAYRVEGEGPFDVMLVPPLAFSIDSREAYEPAFRETVERLAPFARLILFDKRGVGSSDPVVGVPTLEERMDDVRAVMDAVGSRSAALVGVADGAAMSLLFAATFPERTFALALVRLKPRYVWAPDYPWAPTPEEYERRVMEFVQLRIEGRGAELARRNLERFGVEFSDEELREQRRQFRQTMSPAKFLAFHRMNMDIDVRGVLGAVNVPTLLIYRPTAPDADETGDVPLMAYMAEQMPHAEIIEAPAESAFLRWHASLPEPLRDFLPPVWAEHERRQREPQRVLATVLFTDIVGSTATAVELGPRWQELLREHNAVVRREIRKFSGREVDTAGDGFFASGFDGPARAIRCGCAIRDAIGDLGLGVRVGVHTGECDLVEDKLSGLAVHIGARVAAQAEQGEVLVSGTVKDLVAGSGITFESRGVKELKGLGAWPLYAVSSRTSADF